MACSRCLLRVYAGGESTRRAEGTRHSTRAWTASQPPGGGWVKWLGRMLGWTCTRGVGRRGSQMSAAWCRIAYQQGYDPKFLCPQYGKQRILQASRSVAELSGHPPTHPSIHHLSSIIYHLSIIPSFTHSSIHPSFHHSVFRTTCQPHSLGPAPTRSK